MHAVNLVHIDIKPLNIAFSNLRKKHVFLDFGLSRLIKEKPGFKTKTNFRGTINYCSDEMKKCFMISTARFICLYENDQVCLKKTLG